MSKVHFKYGKFLIKCALAGFLLSPLHAQAAEDTEETIKTERRAVESKFGMNISLETSHPIPFKFQEPLTADTAKITWGNLDSMSKAKVFDGGQLNLGTQFLKAYTELALQIGVRMAIGNLYDGSAIGTGVKPDAINNYKATIIPIRFYARFAPFKLRVQPYAGAFIGVNAGSISYLNGPNEVHKESLAQVAAGLRVGLDFLLAGGFGLGLYGEGELSSKTAVKDSAVVSTSGVRFGLSIFYRIKIKPSKIEKVDSSEERLPEAYKNMLDQERAKNEDDEKARQDGETRIQLAFDEIRLGDDMRHDKRCGDAVEHYRKGLSYLPKTKEAAKNVGVPVRLDWAGCLVELDKMDEAVAILREAYEIDPDNMQVVNALEAIGAEAADSRDGANNDEGRAPVYSDDYGEESPIESL